MALNLMYITNNPTVAKVAENAGVDRIWVDMEYLGKDLRQGGMNTVQNRHTVADVHCIRSAITKAELVVRVNPIHEATEEICSSRKEIQDVIANGAEVVMLPFFKTVDEVRYFIDCVNGKAKVLLLLETPEAVADLDDILAIPGIDEIHIGLNDLSLGYKKRFMFELLSDGTVEMLCNKIRSSNIPYGFGGIASLGKGMLPAERVIMEHYRLGSTRAILSRSFCDIHTMSDLDQIRTRFNQGVADIRNYEAYCAFHSELWASNKTETAVIVNRIAEGIAK